MSAKHPVIAVTGFSGAGTTTTGVAFRKIFQQLNIRAAELEATASTLHPAGNGRGDPQGARSGRDISYFGPGPTTSACCSRALSSTAKRHRPFAQVPAHLRRSGAYNPGAGHLHPVGATAGADRRAVLRGAARRCGREHHDVASHVDLLVGVVPIVNLEWIQKLIRDTGGAATPARR